MNKQRGGKVIGAGGFGCVFYPALKCKENEKKFKGISKLSSKKEIFKEEEINNKIRPIIKKIPDYNNYFLITDIFTCNPKPLTKHDMKGLDKCIFLEKYKITQENINDNLNEFDIINIPFGGKELYYIIDNSRYFMNNFSYFNSRFYNLLKFAIIPMNNLGLDHNDIKSNNLLINLKEESSEIKIIDFGLATINSTTILSYGNIPDDIRNRGIQFNLPFSTILFEPSFKNIYEGFLKKLQFIPNELQLKEFTIFYITNFFLESGHTNYIINVILPLIFNENNNKNIKDDTFNNTLGLSLIINYITSILLKFTDFSSKNFKEKEYYYKVFRKNSDIWGFLTIYSDILITTKSKKIKFNKNMLRSFILKFLYTTEFATTPIPQDILLKEIKNLKIELSSNKTRKYKKNF